MTYSARLLVCPCLALCLVAADAAPVAAQTTAPQPATVGTIVENTLEDFRRLPSWESLSILAIGGVAATVGHAADREISSRMSSAEGLGAVLGAGETLGGARTQLAAAVTTYAFGRAAGNATVAAIGADLISAQIVTQAMTAAIKTSVGRTRPDGTEFSFPSGHSSVTFATATVLHRHLGWKAGLPAYGLAAFVAAQRVQDRRHFLSDVTFGAAVGIVAGRSVTIGSGRATFAVAPAPARGGGAVMFTLVDRR